MTNLFETTVLRYNSRLMKDLSISEVQACGIWGNVGAETGGFKHMQELKPVVPGSKGGLGWLQWTGMKPPHGRRLKFENFCKTKGLNPLDEEANYLYLVHETLTDEAHSLNQLRKTTTVESATYTFMKQNLRPGVPHVEARYNWARKANEALKNNRANQSTAAIIVGTGATGAIVSQTEVVQQAIQTGNHWWFWIGMGLVAVGAILWIRKYFRNKQEEVLKETKVKNGKKN